MTTILRVTYAPGKRYGGRWGCYQCCIQSRPGVWAAGTTVGEAVHECLRTAASHGIKIGIDDYVLNKIDLPKTDEERADRDEGARVAGEMIGTMWRGILGR